MLRMVSFFIINTDVDATAAAAASFANHFTFTNAMVFSTTMKA